jgi:regulator of sigma E protease
MGLVVFEWSTWSWIISPTSWLTILLVAVGLGMVIFVHELGHFLVAKLCGVKVEKFYLGFDVAGWKICRFRWGETEYGIGAIPLGGYVKMLGQEDNPARLREEIERAKAAGAVSARPAAGDGDHPVDVAAAEAALYDPRSYLAKSVPKRIAIISAGVIMNLMFAFVAATVAYSIGVLEQPCEIGSVQPGYPAWQYDLRPGDCMVEISGKPARRFRDLLTRIPLSKKGTGTAIRVERPGTAEPIDLVVYPNRDLLLPAIGVANARTTTLLNSAGWLNSDGLKPCLPNTSAARAKPAFRLGDKIIKIDDMLVQTGWRLREMLSARRSKPVRVTVERATGKDMPAEQLTIEVAPQPVRTLGMVMELGPIASVQDHSPASEAGLQRGDRIVAIDGRPLGDPMTLPYRLWTRVDDLVAEGKTPPIVTLKVMRVERVNRDGKVKREEKTLDVPVALRKTDAFETALFPASPVSVPSMGLAYEVLNKVVDVLPDSPAAKAGVVPGDMLVKAKLVPPERETLEREGYEVGDVPEETVGFTKKRLYRLNWPVFFEAMQVFTYSGATVELEFQGGKNVSLTPVDAVDWYHPERGLAMQPAEFMLKAKSFGEAMRLGGEETYLQATLVLRLIPRLISGDISPKVFSGPIAIAQAAGQAVQEGITKFLLFLTMISATLAVINFLPIPVLDGGHFVFLLYEGIRGKPADERIQVALSYLGLLLILALMLWVIALDSTLIPRD